MTRFAAIRPGIPGAPRILILAACLAIGLSASACRGHVSKKQPVRLIRDMTQQAHLLPQAAPSEVKTSNSQLGWLAGTVATEEPADLGPVETGKAGNSFVARAPIAVDDRVIARGQERFNIYCSPCHDKAGTGQGTIVQRGFPGPIDLASDNTRHMTDGELFSIITNGIRNMAALGEQVPISDRWPIVTWVRVLQRSQHAAMVDIEPSHNTNILPAEVNP